MPEPARNYGPPPGLPPVALAVWAMRQIEFAACEGEIRAAMRILTNGPHEPHRSFLRSVRQRLLEGGATPPDASQ